MERIGVIDAPFQRMGLVLNGRRCTLVLRYNKMIDRWSFDLHRDATGDNPIIHGRRIVLYTDLLIPFGLELGSIFAADYEGGEPPAPPGYEALVTGRVRMYHHVEEAVT